jgi:phosphohistidine swiveling domain-containing protein
MISDISYLYNDVKNIITQETRLTGATAVVSRKIGNNGVIGQQKPKGYAATRCAAMI